MNLTTKGRYAVMAMVDLAMNCTDKPVTLADIAKRQDITLNYLEQIFMRLRRAGVVKSVRGPGGGYILADSAKNTHISDIVIAVDESMKMTRCSKKSEGGCSGGNSKCITHNLWEGLGRHILQYLASISLDDVCNRKVSIVNIREHKEGAAHA